MGHKKGQEVSLFNFLREIEEKKKDFAKIFALFNRQLRDTSLSMYSHYPSYSVYFPFFPIPSLFVLSLPSNILHIYISSVYIFSYMLTHSPSCLHIFSLILTYLFSHTSSQTYILTFPPRTYYPHKVAYLPTYIISHKQILRQTYTYLPTSIISHKPTYFPHMHNFPHPYSASSFHIFLDPF